MVFFIRPFVFALKKPSCRAKIRSGIRISAVSKNQYCFVSDFKKLMVKHLTFDNPKQNSIIFLTYLN